MITVEKEDIVPQNHRTFCCETVRWKKHFKYPEAAITDKMLNQLKCCYICYISQITLTVNMSNKS